MADTQNHIDNRIASGYFKLKPKLTENDIIRHKTIGSFMPILK